MVSRQYIARLTAVIALIILAGLAMWAIVTVLGFKIEVLSVQRYGYDRFAANTSGRLRTGGRGFKMIRNFLISLRPLREVRRRG